MDRVEFIRHFFQGERKVSLGTDVFWPKPDLGEFYQDVFTFSSMEDGEYTVYTVGKHVFPKGNDLTGSMQRWMVFFIVSGSIWCGAQQLEVGDFVVVPPLCPQGFMTKSDHVKYYWFTTNDAGHIGAMLRRGYLEKELILGHIDSMQPLVEIFEEMIYKFPTQCDARTYAAGNISRMISFITSVSAQKQKISDQLLRRCLSLIDGTHGAVTVDILAKKCFVSRRYLYTLFKEYKNISPVKYILNVRMMYADRLLTNTDYSISKIAEFVGYANYSHFTRAYTKYFSMSPTQRRRQTRKTTYMDEALEETNTHTLEG